MPFDYSQLKGSIKAIYDKQSDFAAALGISERSLSLKLNNKVPFTQPEIYRSSELLKLNSAKMKSHFFTKMP